MAITGIPRSSSCVEVRVRRALRRLAGQSIATSGDIPTTSGPFANFNKVTKTFSDFAIANTSNTITLFQMPARGVLLALMAHHTTAFTGGLIATYTMAVGVTAAHTKYTPGAGTFNVFNAPGNGPDIISGTNIPDCLDLTTTWNITATAACTGANLNAATQGSCDFWLLVATAP